MLPKVNRLKKKKDFERVFKKGKGFGEKFLALKILRNNKGKSRIGFIVPKKHFKKAVLRNKLKRQLREQIKKRLPKIKESQDIVIITKPGLQNLDFWEIDKMLETLLLKANVLEK